MSEIVVDPEVIIVSMDVVDSVGPGLDVDVAEEIVDCPYFPAFLWSASLCIAAIALEGGADDFPLDKFLGAPGAMFLGWRRPY